MRAVYCSKFGYDTRESDLESLFSQYGKVERIEMKTGYAFVYFEDDNDAENAIRGLNGRKRSEPGFHRCKLVVQWATNDRGSHGSSGCYPIRNRTLFVTNFDPVLTQYHDIKSHFEPYGKVLSVRIYWDYAFVHFDTQENATKALECTHLSKLFGIPICVEYATRPDVNEEVGHLCQDRDSDEEVVSSS
ncbi:serine/arginine-rich splicing factor RS31-like [Salvia divinorum]|uniref:Serine/arginine-rich splicing factor RS31-like n=1 Tax=Salvia divinorum TaxID=28513 RepID=A0ABD1IB08_SALDI